MATKTKNPALRYTYTYTRPTYKHATILLVCLLLLLTGCGGNSKEASAVTPTPISNPYQLVSYPLDIPTEAFDAPREGELPANTSLHVNITFKMDQHVLNQINQGHDYVPENYAQNSDALAKRIGISDATYAQIKAFFGVQGISLKLNKLHTSLTVDANASAFERLLNIKFVYHKLNGRTFFTPDKANISMPRILADNIEAIVGLDNYSEPPHRNGSMTRQSIRQSAAHQILGASRDCTVYFDAVAPTQLAHIYGIDQLWKSGWNGAGSTISLIEFEAFDQSDVQHYFDCVDYKGKLKTVTIGKAPMPDDAMGEAALDIEMIAGLAPGANIVVYQTGLSDDDTWRDSWGYFLDQLDQILTDNLLANHPNALSISWGGSERTITRSVVHALESRFDLLYKFDHMTTYVASGDCGAFDSGIYGKLSVDIPSAIPSVTAVGGTVLDFDGSANRLSEVAWSNNDNTDECKNHWGTGGGLSTIFKRPDWQTGPGVENEYTNGYRQIPDIAAVAQELPVYLQGEWFSIGGTSASAPIWAAAMAVMNEGLLRQTGYYVSGPRIFYNVAANHGDLQPYYDVNSGGNLHYPATSGWDFATGLGTPNMADFHKVLVQFFQLLP